MNLPHAVSVLRAMTPLAALGVAAATLMWLPPAQYGFYPECPVYRTLHVLCPGCGTMRALAALLRGNWDEAMCLNALTTLMAPVILSYGVECYRRFLRRQPLDLPRVPGWAICGGLVAAGVFMVVRNLEG